jgi:hypothetical protein
MWLRPGLSLDARSSVVRDVGLRDAIAHGTFSCTPTL